MVYPQSMGLGCKECRNQQLNDEQYQEVGI